MQVRMTLLHPRSKPGPNAARWPQPSGMARPITQVPRKSSSAVELARQRRLARVLPRKRRRRPERSVLNRQVVATVKATWVRPSSAPPRATASRCGSSTRREKRREYLRLRYNHVPG